MKNSSKWACFAPNRTWLFCWSSW